MGRRRVVNLRKLNESDGDYYKSHIACPFKLEWRDPLTKKSQRKFIGVIGKNGKVDIKASKASAERTKMQIEDQLNMGDDSGLPRIMTWDRAVDQYMSKPGISDATKYDYQRALTVFATISGKPSSERWSITLLDYFKKQRMSQMASNSPAEGGRKVSANTVNKDLVSLRAFFRWCNKRFNTPNPFDKLDRNESLLKVEHRIKPVWTPEQFELMLKNLDDQWRIMALMYLTGMGRRATLESITLDRIHLDGHCVIDFEKKTNKESLVFIHPRLEAELRNYIKKLPDNQTNLFTCKFHHTTWNKLIKRLQIPHLPLHDMRTCAMTWLAEAGVSDLITSKILNHSDPKTTRDHYTEMNMFKVRQEAILKLPI